MIRQNKNIRGIKIGKEKVCLLQYADDTVLFLDGSEKSLKSALDLLFQFSKFSGLKPNISKTKAVWIGSKINSNTICSDTGLQWTTEPFTILGVTYTANLKNMEQLNFDNKLKLVQKEINHWLKRNISTLGKITVVKSLLLSKFTHLFTSLPKPSTQWIRQFEKTLYNFIWGNKIDKISRKTLQLNYEKGGCRMTNVEIFIKSLKLTWIRRLLTTNSSWISIFSEITGCHTYKLCQFGPEYCRQRAKATRNNFWKETLFYLCDFLETIETDNINIMLEPLWYNNKVKIQNKYVFCKALYEKGFHIVHDLFDTQGEFISYERITNEYPVKIPFTTYEGLKRAIICAWPNVKQFSHQVIIKPYQPESIKILCLCKKGARNIYDHLMVKSNHKPICENKWAFNLNLPLDFNWKQAYSNPRSATKDSGLIWFNYRIIHRILGTNKILHMCKIKNSPLCSICFLEPETITHLFFYCPSIFRIWLLMSDWIFRKSGERIVFDAKTVIFGVPEKKYLAINLIIMLVKRHIFSQSRKSANIAFENIVKYLQNYYSLEKLMLENRFYQKKWSRWVWLFDVA